MPRTERPEQLAHGCFTAGAHQERAQDGAHDAHACDEERQHYPRREVAGARGGNGCCDRNGGYDGRGVGLEQVGTHAGHVAHVVAHVVGDGCRVPGVVLRNARLHLAHDVGTNVCSLGEYASANACEEGNGRCAEPEACYHRDVLQDEVEDRNADDADADHRYAHDGAAGEGHAKAGVEADHGSACGARVGPDGDAHAYVARAG